MNATSHDTIAEIDTCTRLGAWLHARISESGWTVSQLAADLDGISKSTLYNWRRGEHLPAGEADHFYALLCHSALALQSRQRQQLDAIRKALTSPSPSASTAPRQRSLPANPTHFSGRRRELAKLAKLLSRRQRTESPEICVVSGPGGVGKTALTVHWARSRPVSAAFGDGVAYIDLNGFSGADPTGAQEAQTRLLRQLGVDPERIPLNEDALRLYYLDTLRSKDLLLVLDNAKDEPQVRPLLPVDGISAAVVTSRNRLAGLSVTHDASQVSLSALAARESNWLMRRLLGDAAEREPNQVRRLAEVCAHLPLALRIAAAGYLTAESAPTFGDYVAKVAQARVERLHVGPDDPATAMETVLDWSFRNLSQPAQRALCLLAEHPGDDWDSYAAAALLGEDLGTATRLIELLHDHSLLDLAPSRHGMRCRMHDLTAEYARASHLDARERRAAVSRLQHYYLDAATTAVDERLGHATRSVAHSAATSTPLPRFADAEAAAGWLQAERRNIVDVSQLDPDDDYLNAVTKTLGSYLLLSGYHRLAVQLHTYAARQLTDLGDQAREHTRLGHVHCTAGDIPAAVACLEEAVNMARTAGNTAVETSALTYLGRTYERHGDLQAAIRTLRTALDLVQEGADSSKEAGARYFLGLTHMRMGQLAEARDLFTRSMELARREGLTAGVCPAAGALGYVCMLRGDYAPAARHLNECLEIAHDTGQRDAEINALSALGLLFLRQRQLDRAETTLRQALTLAESFDGTFATAHVLANTARLHLESGDLVRAEDDSVRALELLGDGESADPTAELHNLRGAIARLHGRLDEAEQLHRKACAVAASAEHCYEHACALDGLGRVAAMRGDHAAAGEHFTQAWRLFDRMGAPEADEVAQRRDQLATSAAVTGSQANA